jgi:hypothetical protein
VSREGSGGESAGRIPREGESGVDHVEWTEEELLGIENGGLWGVTRRGIEHQRRAIGRELLVITTRAVRERLHGGGERKPDGREGAIK